jgi:hypothetical protein
VCCQPAGASHRYYAWCLQGKFLLVSSGFPPPQYPSSVAVSRDCAALWHKGAKKGILRPPGLETTWDQDPSPPAGVCSRVW